MADFKARPTIYKGTQMRSRLEAGFAGWLDRMHHTWEYEPHAVGDEHGQYLPDFLVRRVFRLEDDIFDAYIEIKPTLEAVDWEKLGRAARQLWSAADRCLFLVIPGQSPRIIWHTSTPGNEARDSWFATWTFAYTPDGQSESAHLAIAAFEPPLSKDWWT